MEVAQTISAFPYTWSHWWTMIKLFSSIPDSWQPKRHYDVRAFRDRRFAITPYSFTCSVSWPTRATALRWLIDNIVGIIANDLEIELRGRFLLRLQPLSLISKSFVCFRKFSNSLSRSLWWDRSGIYDIVYSPWEDPSSESTLVSCPSCMC